MTDIDSQMISSFDVRSTIASSEECIKVFVAPVFTNVNTRMEGQIVTRVSNLLGSMSSSNHDLTVSVGELKATLVEASKLLSKRISTDAE